MDVTPHPARDRLTEAPARPTLFPWEKAVTLTRVAPSPGKKAMTPSPRVDWHARDCRRIDNERALGPALEKQVAH